MVDSVSFSVVPQGGSIPPGLPELTSSTVTANGSLSLGFTVHGGLAHDMQGCLVGSGWGGFAEVTLPPQVANYTLELARANGSIIARMVAVSGGGPSAPFDVWAELRYPYSFTSASDPRLLVEVEEPVATTPTFTPPITTGNFSVPLDMYAHLREGKYSLLVYVRNQNGLFLEQASVLMLAGGSWLWLGGCSPLVNAGPEFTARVPLSSATVWPYYVFVSYANNGTEGYVESRVPINLTSLSAFVVPWGGRLPSGFALDALSGAGLLSVRSWNSTLYAQFQSLPADLKVLVTFHGRAIQNSTIRVTQKYGALTLTVPLGKLQVAVLTDDAPVPGAQVRVLGADGSVDVGATGASGNVAFLLPSGNYTVETTLANSTQSRQAVVRDGIETTVLFSSISSKNYGPEYLLAAIAVLAAAANLWVWLRMPSRGLRRTTVRGSARPGLAGVPHHSGTRPGESEPPG